MLVQARIDAVDRTLNGLLWWSGVGLLLTAAVSVGVGWMFAGRVLAPVHTITSRARAISAHALDERVSLGGPHDELRELADTFDSLLDRIHEAFAGERRLVATMSHELRTPLANQQVALDVRCPTPTPTAAELRSAAEVALDQNRPRGPDHRRAAHPGPGPVRRSSRPGTSRSTSMALVTEAVDRVRAERGVAGLAPPPGAGRPCPATPSCSTGRSATSAERRAPQPAGVGGLRSTSGCSRGPPKRSGRQ